MNIEKFISHAKIAEVTELEKVALLAFYQCELAEQDEFQLSTVSELLQSLGFAKPNRSRLASKIQASRNFIKGGTKGSFRLSIKKKSALLEVLGQISQSEEVFDDETILATSILIETRRTYLVKLAQQINSSYENNLFDGCALLMRRLLEILIIHVFENTQQKQMIIDTEGNFRNLKFLIAQLNSNQQISLSNSAGRSAGQIRELGNLSAHRIHYNCRRQDIHSIRIEYRALIEELLYKTGFLT